MSISTRTGTEGPRHDPYSFTEITVEARGHRVTVHYGLGEWIEVDGSQLIGAVGFHRSGAGPVWVLMEVWAEERLGMSST